MRYLIAALAVSLLGCDRVSLPTTTTLYADQFDTGASVSSSRRSECPTVTFDPPNFTNRTVATVEGCAEKPQVTWVLLTNPDGLVYRTYVNMPDLIMDRPGPGPILRVHHFIAGNPICFDMVSQYGTKRVAMLDTPQSVCEAL